MKNPTLTREEVIRCSIEAVENGGFRAIRKYVLRERPQDVISSAVIDSWPDLPPPLVLWLLSARHPVQTWRNLLTSLEAVLRHLENQDKVTAMRQTGQTSAWRSRAKDLAPKGSRKTNKRFESATLYYSSLFELNTIYRLTRFSGFHARLNGDQVRIDSIILDTRGSEVCGIEFYAPVQGMKEDYEEEEQHWRELTSQDNYALYGESGYQTRGLELNLQNLFLDPNAIPKSLAKLTSRERFGNKPHQLDQKTFPTLCAVQLFRVNPRFGSLVSLLNPSNVQDRFPPGTFEALPDPCLGLLLCWISSGVAGGERIDFVPAPGKQTGPPIQEFFKAANIAHF